MPRRETRSGVAAVISCPLKRTRPRLGRISPERRLRNVVLPAPLGPMMACVSPRRNPSDTPFTAASAPNDFDSPSVSSRNSVIAGGSARDDRRFAAAVLVRRPPSESCHQASDPIGQEQNDANDEKPDHQQPVFGERRKVVLEQDEDERADDRPVERAHAAQDNDDQRLTGLPP